MIVSFPFPLGGGCIRNWRWKCCGDMICWLGFPGIVVCRNWVVNLESESTKVVWGTSSGWKRDLKLFLCGSSVQGRFFFTDGILLASLIWSGRIVLSSSNAYVIVVLCWFILCDALYCMSRVWSSISTRTGLSHLVGFHPNWNFVLKDRSGRSSRSS